METFFFCCSDCIKNNHYCLNYDVKLNPIDVISCEFQVKTFLKNLFPNDETMQCAITMFFCNCVEKLRDQIQGIIHSEGWLFLIPYRDEQHNFKQLNIFNTHYLNYYGGISFYICGFATIYYAQVTEQKFSLNRVFENINLTDCDVFMKEIQESIKEKSFVCFYFKSLGDKVEKIVSEINQVLIGLKLVKLKNFSAYQIYIATISTVTKRAIKN